MPYVKKGAKKQKVRAVSENEIKANECKDDQDDDEHDVENSERETVYDAENSKMLQLADAVKHLTVGDTKQLSENQISLCLNEIETASLSNGLSEDYLAALIGVIANEDFSIKSRKRLISCLIPSHLVPEEAVIKATSCMTLKSLPISLQASLAKWLNSMYDRLSKTEVLSFLYTVLFELLRNDSLCPFICELLCKVTTKKHVTALHMRRLIMMESRLGTQPCISTLLKSYAEYKPDLLLLTASEFKNTTKFRRILTQVMPQTNEVGGTITQAEAPNTSQTIIEYDRLSEEIQNLNGSSAILKLCSATLRRVMLTSNLPENLLFCFRAFLKSGLFIDDSPICSRLLPIHSKEKLMPVLSELASELQESIPEVLLFLGSYLRIWDGQTNQVAVFNLIARWEICKYEHLWKAVLQPLHTLFYSASMEFMCSVIRCLTDLYRHWVVFELPRFIQNTGKPSTMVTNYKITSIFQRDYEEFDPVEQINALSVFIGKLCDIAVLCYSRKQVKLLNCILRFYETVTSMNSYNRFILLLVPSQIVVARIFFSRNPFLLSEISDLICKYKDAIIAMKRNNSVSDLNAQVLFIVNKYIIDFSNMFALGAAFEPKENSAFFQSTLPTWLKRSVYEVNESFNICRHPALLGLALLFQRKHNRKTSHVALLKEPDVRKEYLQFLSSVNFSSISTFLTTFVNAL